MSGTGGSDQAPEDPASRSEESEQRQLPGNGGASAGGQPSQELVPQLLTPEPRSLVASEAALGLTWTAFSFIILYWACQALDLETTTWTVISLWILSGLAMLWRGSDALLTRVLLSVRQPTMVELRRLMPSWSAAANRIGVYGPRYTLWVEDSKEVSASVTVGYTVAVTHWSLFTVPPAHLEAILARELLTHLSGRTWFSRLAAWYSIPARLVALGIRLLVKLSRTIPAVGWTIVCFLLVSYLGLILVAVVFFDDRVGPLLYLTPLLAPLVLLGLRRWNERMADRAAADLGYGPRLIEVLYNWQSRQQAEAIPSTTSQPFTGNSAISERIRALEIYQQRLDHR